MGYYVKVFVEERNASGRMEVVEWFLAKWGTIIEDLAEVGIFEKDLPKDVSRRVRREITRLKKDISFVTWVSESEIKDSGIYDNLCWLAIEVKEIKPTRSEKRRYILYVMY